MDEVEYCLIRKNDRLSADEIKLLEKGTVVMEVYHLLVPTTVSKLLCVHAH